MAEQAAFCSSVRKIPVCGGCKSKQSCRNRANCDSHVQPAKERPLVCKECLRLQLHWSGTEAWLVVSNQSVKEVECWRAPWLNPGCPSAACKPQQGKQYCCLHCILPSPRRLAKLVAPAPGTKAVSPCRCPTRIRDNTISPHLHQQNAGRCLAPLPAAGEGGVTKVAGDCYAVTRQSHRPLQAVAPHQHKQPSSSAGSDHQSSTGQPAETHGNHGL